MFVAGLDLAQASDHTALAIIERIEARPAPVELHLRHVERWRGMPYAKMSQAVADRLKTLKHYQLAVDFTGVGRSAVEQVEACGLRARRVTIHGGDKQSEEGGVYRVPKRDLCAGVQVALQNRVLRIAAGQEWTDLTRAELQNFRVKIDPQTAHDSYSAWREGQHDDVVLAVALAVWLAGRTSPPLPAAPLRKVNPFGRPVSRQWWNEV